MRIKLWGVRGSIPTPLNTYQLQEKLFKALIGAREVDLSEPGEVQAYIASLPPEVRSVVGGNTACVEVDTGDDFVIVDCGSGMRALGLSLMSREFGRGLGTAHIFLSHGHWDHLQGFPLFAPAYVPGNKLIFYAVNSDPRQYLEHQQTAPIYFPVSLARMEADMEFVQLREDQAVTLGRTTITSLALDHPGTAFAFRFDDSENVFVYASDGEYKSLDEPDLRRYVDFFREADALLFDAQFSLRDALLTKADWGHSSAVIGVEIAMRAGVRQLITFHHEPTHSDEQIFEVASTARRFAAVSQSQPRTEVIVGAEGLELILGQPFDIEILTEKTRALWTLVLAGQLDASTAPRVEAALTAALKAAPGGRVLTDLTGCTALDGIGARTLLTAARSVPGGQMAVIAPDDRIRRILKRSGAPEILRVSPGYRQARAALLGPARLVLADKALIGNYRLDTMLLVGEVGAIYAGVSVVDQHPIVGQIVGALPGDPLSIQFAAEREIWTRLRHPGLVPGEDLLEGPDWIAFISARPEGISLRRWLAADPSMTERLQLANALTDIMAFIHQQGALHGGLAPANISIRPLPAGAEPAIARIPLFAYGHPFGPAAYRAPEHIRDEPVIQRSDVYLLGLILFEIIVDVHPFDAETEDLMITLQFQGSPEYPRLRWPDIPPDLEILLLKTLALDPADRYPSALEVRDELLRITTPLLA